MLMALIFCGALERYPNLKIVIGEAGLGWIPYVLQHMDLEWEDQFQDLDLKMKPERVLAPPVLRHLPDRPGRHRAARRISARTMSCGARTFRIPTASGPTRRSSSTGSSTGVSPERAAR